MIRSHLIAALLVGGPPACFVVGLLVDDLATLLTRAGLLAALGVILFVGAAAAAPSLVGVAALEVECPECEGAGGPCCSDTGVADAFDIGDAMDRGHDEWVDRQMRTA